eukprot:TRINITY_DN3034_c0_g2_i9.p1 TRINITY_DN3034_c0_g2~~TRINITY_DN3034_c0_g2_i9.p1  ORF type:complete len:248 (+),score=52.39 TRINITY_DN3034_c0_g2_i9:120-863(+)
MSDKRSRRSPTRTRKRSRSPSPDHHSSRPRSPKTKCEDVKIEPEDRKVPKEVPSNRDLSPPRKKRAEDDRETWGKKEEEKEEELDDSDKEKPDFKPSGLLTKELKTRKGVELIYTECEEGRQPNTKWRLYPVKENNTLDPYKIYRKSYYLLGRDRKVVDIPLDHPSCSKQHAVIQFRMVTIESSTLGETLLPRRVNKPYIMDLKSTNGTLLNGRKIDSLRYIELVEKDIIKFGNSTREFVLLHEDSK